MKKLLTLAAFLFLILPSHAQIMGTRYRTLFSACSKTGSTFTESMGDTPNGALCADGVTAGCTQPWSVQQGSASDVSIVAAPYSGFDCPKVMKLALDTANQPQVATYGTLQDIPSTATTDLYAEFSYDSSNTQGQAFIYLTAPGGGNAYYASPAGGGACWLGNGSVQVACAPGVRHLLHIHMSGSSSYDQLDGGSHNTFTANSNPWWSIVLGGDSKTANFYWGNVYASDPAIGSCLNPPMILVNGAGGTGTVTTSNLATGTHGGNKNEWAIGTLSDVAFAYGSSSSAFPLSTSVCGSSFTGTEGQQIVESLTASSSDPNGALSLEEYTTATGGRVGFEFSYTSAGLNQGVDSFALADSSGTIDNIQVDTVGSSQELCFETDRSNAPTAPCVPVALQQNTPYWISFGVSASGNDTMYLYSYPSMTLLGSVASGEPDLPFIGPQLYVLIGKTGSEPVAFNMTETFSDILVDLSSASGPLLPNH